MQFGLSFGSGSESLCESLHHCDQRSPLLLFPPCALFVGLLLALFECQLAFRQLEFLLLHLPTATLEPCDRRDQCPAPLGFESRHLLFYAPLALLKLQLTIGELQLLLPERAIGSLSLLEIRQQCLLFSSSLPRRARRRVCSAIFISVRFSLCVLSSLHEVGRASHPPSRVLSAFLIVARRLSELRTQPKDLPAVQQVRRVAIALAVHRRRRGVSMSAVGALRLPNELDELGDGVQHEAPLVADARGRPSRPAVRLECLATPSQKAPDGCCVSETHAAASARSSASSHLFPRSIVTPNGGIESSQSGRDPSDQWTNERTDFRAAFPAEPPASCVGRRLVHRVLELLM